MKTLCDTCDDFTICDFCRFYNYNGEWEWLRDRWVQVYTEDGFCMVTMLPCDPYDDCDCDSYYCFRAKLESGIK